MKIALACFLAALLSILQVQASPDSAAVVTGFPASLSSRNAQSISQSLTTKGSARIIVELKVRKPLSTLSSSQRLADHKRAVKSVQDRVMDRNLGRSRQATKAGKAERQLRQYAMSPMIAVTVNSEELKSLALDPEVQQIHPDRLSKPLLQNSVPLIGMDGVDGAYALGATGLGQAVAVLDTGVQASHPFLSGKTILEACYSSSTGGDVSLCPNGSTSQTGTGAADATTANCFNGSENLCTHGTHVAGIAVGKNPNPGIPPNGVAKEASLIAIQVFTRINDSWECGGFAYTPCVMSYESDQLAGLEWVFAQRSTLPLGAKLASVNMSLGGGEYASACDYDPLKPIIDDLRSAGVATAVASGNDGYTASVSSPACISTSVSVGATTLSDRIADFSNESRTLVDLLAPGVDILSSVPVSTYESLSGTSMATPHVAGAFAAIKSHLPDLSVSEIEQALKSTGTPVSSSTGRYTTPRISVNAALEQLGPVQWNLTVTKTGSGTVTSSPAGITCGASCSASYDSGTAVTLSASPAEGFRFSGWSGACTGSTTCTVSMTTPQTVNASFVALQTLNVTKTGSGTVTSSPAGITCGASCSASYDSGTTVTLSASPAEGFRFSGWSGACTGSTTCTVSMTSTQTVNASFVALQSLNVTKFGEGLVTSQPRGIECGAACSAQFENGSQITLHALAANGYQFTGWNGACNTSTSSCLVSMNSNQNVSANFDALPKYVLNVAKVNTGIVNSSPDGILCGGTFRECKSAFSYVTLTATPNNGYEFTGWTGCPAPEGNTCSVTLKKATTLKPAYRKIPDVTLKVNKNTLGSVASSPTGLICPNNKKSCSTRLPRGTEILLTPAPLPGHTFVIWTGDCAGTTSCRLLMDGNKTAGALFQ